MIILLILILIIIGVLILENTHEIKTFRVTNYKVQTRKLPSSMNVVKIAVISDLHNKVYGKCNEELLAKIKEQNPDVIIIAGDMLTAKEGHSYDVAIAFMQELVHISTVYYGNGNHEQRMKLHPERYTMNYQEYKSKLQDLGVVFLENETIKLNIHQEEMLLSAIEIPEQYFQKRCYQKLTVEEMNTVLKRETDRYHLLIAHNPVHAQTYVQWGADLVFSGHLHGGIIRIPFLCGLITPQMNIFPKYSGGLYKIKESYAVVSKGLGEHTVKLRLFNYPEVVMVHLTGVN